MRLTGFVRACLFAFAFAICGGHALARFIQADPVGLDGGMSLYSYVDNDPIGSTDPDGLTKRNGTGNPRPASTPGQSSSWNGQQGAWFRGQFYPRVAPPPEPSTIQGNYCGYPPVGGTPQFGRGRTNTVGSGDAGTTFIQNSGPGPYSIGSMPGGGTRISAPGTYGGSAQIRFNPDGSTRVDIFPPAPQIPETIHWKP